MDRCWRFRLIAEGFAVMLSKKLDFALKICVSVTLLARGWLTWRWDSPVRGLVWKEGWWAEVLERHTDLTWAEFARVSDQWITTLEMVLGILLIVSAVVPWLPRNSTSLSRLRWLLLPATLVLALDAFARWVGANYDLGMGMEHSLQILAPLAFFIARGKAPDVDGWIRLVSIGAVLTFAGHGLYALGFHPVPLSYQAMTMKLLGCGQETALVFLKIFGWLDFLAIVCVSIRFFRLAGLGYMIVWGAATALARVAAYGSADGLDPWLAETLVRTPHWLLPAIALPLVLQRREARAAVEPDAGWGEDS